MPKKHTRDRCEAARLELIEALIEYRGEALMEATIAGCALVAHADGEVVPAEMRRMLADMRTDPLLSMFPRDTVVAEFEAHGRALALHPAQARAQALRQIKAAALQPRLARVVLNACLAVTRADDLVHPSEVEQVRLVRDALGLAPDPGGAPARTGRRSKRQAGPVVPGPALAGTASRTAAPR